MFNRVGSTYKGDKIPKLTKILYPWSGIFRDACYALVGSFLLQYAMTSGVLSSNYETYSTQMSIITVAMMIALVWDGINDPVMGFLVEKFHFKTGKFRPWILIGAIGNAIAVTCMFVIRPSFGDGWVYVWLMIAFYILWDTFFTMNDVGYWSMLPSLTNDPAERASITTKTTIATSIGAFAMNLGMFVLPSMLGAASAYFWVAIIISLLFLASQASIFFFCQEKERDAEQEEISENSSILDLFTIVAKNKQLLVIVVVMFLYYLCSGLLTGVGLNYFYMVFGYTGMTGGIVASMLSVVYVVATVLAQVFYPMLSKKLPKMKVMTIMTIITIIGYLAFFFIAFPVFGDNPIAYNDPTLAAAEGAGLGEGLAFAFGGSMWMLYLTAFFFFGATGIFYLGLLVMYQDAIDYNEYKFGERKESIAFAWRPLTVKLGSALQTAIRTFTYTITGTLVAINMISKFEGYNAGGYYELPEHAGESFREDILAYAPFNPADGSRQSGLTLFGIIIIGIIVVCFIACYLLLKFGYKIDEKMEEEIVRGIALKREGKEASKHSESSEAPASAIES